MIKSMVYESSDKSRRMSIVRISSPSWLAVKLIRRETPFKTRAYDFVEGKTHPRLTAAQGGEMNYERLVRLAVRPLATLMGKRKEFEALCDQLDRMTPEERAALQEAQEEELLERLQRRRDEKQAQAVARLQKDLQQRRKEF